MSLLFGLLFNIDQTSSDKAKQGKARQGKVRQGKTRQDKSVVLLAEWATDPNQHVKPSVVNNLNLSLNLNLSVIGGWQEPSRTIS